MLEKIHKFICEQRLLQPGDRVAVACSGGADSVALLRILGELSQAIGIVLSVAHFNHQIRGAEADADQQFVQQLAATLQLEFHTASGDVPAHAVEHKASLETAARELRHQWFAELIRKNATEKIATAHTMDDQAETVVMRVIRGTGARGLAGIAPAHQEKYLVRPLLSSTRSEIEDYLNKIGQTWREDPSNRDLAHTRNQIRHTLMPLLEREFNPSIRQTLAELAELARAEEEYWRHELQALLPRLVHEGKPSRSGRSTSGEARGVLALDLAGLMSHPLAMRRQVLHATANRLGVSLEFKHIQQLILLAEQEKPGKKLVLPDGLTANRTAREIHFGRFKGDIPVDYCYTLPIPGEVAVPELGIILRASVISDGKQKASGYNGATFLDPSLLGSKLLVRNWRAGDRFLPALSQSPKKVKELLQPGRMGHEFSSAQRKMWPVIESKGRIVWMRGFPVSQDFAGFSGDAILIEEVTMTAEAEE